MSTTNAPAYCNVDDVKAAMQQADANIGGNSGPLENEYVEAAIYGASKWFSNKLNAHWYDSNANSADLISSASKSLTDLQLDMPSAAHPPRGQLRFTNKTRGPTRYPKTHAGPFARVRLPVRYVESIDRLAVRDRSGDVEDWVASADFTEGKDGDYYVGRKGQNSYGRVNLYIHAGSIGSRTHYTNMFTVDVSYGLDWDTEPWDDVRRGVAAIAGAQVVHDDNVLTQIPDNGQLISVETQAQALLNQAFSDSGYLSPYMAAPVA